MALITLLLIVLVSEFVSERTFVSMMGDVWMLPFLVAIYALPPSPNHWLTFVRISHLLFEGILI